MVLQGFQDGERGDWGLFSPSEASIGASAKALLGVVLFI